MHDFEADWSPIEEFKPPPDLGDRIISVIGFDPRQHGDDRFERCELVMGEWQASGAYLSDDSSHFRGFRPTHFLRTATSSGSHMPDPPEAP